MGGGPQVGGPRANASGRRKESTSEGACRDCVSELIVMPQAIRILSTISLIFTCNWAFAANYSTNFQSAENPISESGRWKNGARDGLDWTDCRTKPGLIYSTESGSN